MIIEIEKNEENIDWDKQNILISHDEDTIVITDGEHNATEFSGLAINHGMYEGNPQFNNDWVKNCFKLFKGTIKN